MVIAEMTWTTNSGSWAATAITVRGSSLQAIYLMPHLHFFSPHPLTAFLVDSIKPYATLISTAKTGGDLFFTMASPDRIIHLFPFSFNCRSAFPGWLPHSVLSRVGNLKYHLELVTLNTHIFSLTVKTALTSSSAPSMVSMCLRHFTEGVAKDQISQGS